MKNENAQFGFDFELDNKIMEDILTGIKHDSSEGFYKEHQNVVIPEENSFVKFDTREMRHFSIEDITFNSTIRGYDVEKAKYHRIIKSGIKYAEYSLKLSKKQRKNTMFYSGVKKFKTLHLNQERSTASASIIASVTILRSLLYNELPTNTKWVYYSFYPLILSSYLQAYNDFMETGGRPKGGGFLSRAMQVKKNQALYRINSGLLRISRHINKVGPNGRYNYSVKPWSFWKLVEPTIVSPAHGLITTDLIKRPKSLSGEYLKDVMSILRSNKYKLAIAQNKAREDFYYYVNHDLEVSKD